MAHSASALIYHDDLARRSSTRAETSKRASAAASERRPTTQSQPTQQESAEARQLLLAARERDRRHRERRDSEAARLARAKAERRYCCCFRTRAGCGTTMCCLVIFILAGLAVGGYFLWPRWPTVTVSDPYARTDGTPVFQSSGSAFTASKTQPFTLGFNLVVDVNAFSPNYEDINVDVLSFDGKLLDLDGVKVLPGAIVAGTDRNIMFPHGKSTKFQLVGAFNNWPFTIVIIKVVVVVMIMQPITLSYTLTTPVISLSGLAGTDEVVNTLLTSCGIGGAGRNLNVDYTVSVSIGVISWTGYKPSFSGKLNFACPVSSSALSGLF
ncbi:hypothetical protein HK101_007672 [Irineochytrium annulatum]|nr:hypothetical protein HK101_007672 [Irineochytrium annulatum]